MHSWHTFLETLLALPAAPSFWLCVGAPLILCAHILHTSNKHTIDGWQWILPSSAITAIITAHWDYSSEQTSLLIPPWTLAVLALWTFFRHLNPHAHPFRFSWEQSTLAPSLFWALSWITTLTADIWHAHASLFPSQGWAYLHGIGGAGPLDGLFIFPLCSALFGFYSLSRASCFAKTP